jgi:uncharacterized protein (TIGR02118 family)
VQDLIKTIALIKRRPDISREEFARHYEEVHVPLALRHFRDWKGYVRNHVVEAPAGREPAFDCISEFWYSDRRGLQRAVEFTTSEAAAPVRDDELAFMDKSGNAFFVATETVIAGDPGRFRADGLAKAIALVKRRAGVQRDEFLASYETKELPRLLAGAAVVRCSQNRIETEVGGASETAFDCITEIWFGDREDRLEAMGRFRPETGSAILVAVSEFESACGE